MYSLADGALRVHRNHASHHLAGLIEAATAAAGQDTYLHGGITRSEFRPTAMSPSNDISRKRKWHSETTTSHENTSQPEKCQVGATDELIKQHVLPEDSDERSIGAPLFRSPKTTTKKYTRPPMSKLYTSLDLDPERFLHLQAAAKTYMLDPDHPERRNCVGQRGKGDSEAVKSKLWSTVAQFLSEEGHGYTHFGEQVLGERGLPRTMVWPQNKSKVGFSTYHYNNTMACVSHDPTRIYKGNL